MYCIALRWEFPSPVPSSFPPGGTCFNNMDCLDVNSWIAFFEFFESVFLSGCCEKFVSCSTCSSFTFCWLNVNNLFFS